MDRLTSKGVSPYTKPLTIRTPRPEKSLVRMQSASPLAASSRQSHSIEEKASGASYRFSSTLAVSATQGDLAFVPPTDPIGQER